MTGAESETRIQQFVGSKWYWMLLGAGAMALFDLGTEGLIWWLEQQQAAGGLTL